jgi:hypothetical protein
MTAPPQSIASLDGTAAVAAQTQHATAAWDTYYGGNANYEPSYAYYPSGYPYNTQTGHGSAAPGMGGPTSPHAVAGGHPHGHSGGNGYSG